MLLAEIWQNSQVQLRYFSDTVTVYHKQFSPIITLQNVHDMFQWFFNQITYFPSKCCQKFFGRYFELLTSQIQNFPWNLWLNVFHDKWNRIYSSRQAVFFLTVSSSLCDLFLIKDYISYQTPFSMKMKFFILRMFWWCVLTRSYLISSNCSTNSWTSSMCGKGT